MRRKLADDERGKSAIDERHVRGRLWIAGEQLQAIDLGQLEIAPAAVLNGEGDR